MSRVAILGGAGFIGSALAHHLLQDSNNEILVIDRLDMGNGLEGRGINDAVTLRCLDVTDPLELFQTLSEFRPDTVYHLAANSDIRQSSMDPRVDVENTFQTTASLALALTKLSTNPVVLVFSSTSAIYGQQDSLIGVDTIPNPNSSYGWMKLASEALVSSLLNSGHLEKAVVLRFPNVTGAGQTHGVVRDLVAKYLNETSDWQILGNGRQTKPYLHVEELVKVMGSIAEECPVGQRLDLNLSPTSRASVDEIVGWIEEVGKLKRKPHFQDSKFGWKGDVPEYAYDTTKQESMGYVFSSSEEALKRSIKEEFGLDAN